MILQNFTFPRAIALLDEIPYPPEKIAFLDLETKAYGRKNSHILYLGLIFLENSTWQVRQWLPEEPEEEKTMLQEVLSLLPCFSCLIHYNGNSFDLPVLTKRCSALNLPLDLSQMESVDLYRAFSGWNGPAFSSTTCSSFPVFSHSFPISPFWRAVSALPVLPSRAATPKNPPSPSRQSF